MIVTRHINCTANKRQLRLHPKHYVNKLFIQYALDVMSVDFVDTTMQLYNIMLLFRRYFLSQLS